VKRFNIIGSFTLALVATAVATSAHAQSASGSVLIDTAIPPDFDKGRNVSVQEKARPDYDPLGINVGSLNVFPSLSTYAGLTDNVLLSGSNRDTDGFAGISPALRVESDWNRHQLRARARGDFQRFFSTPRRNQNNWDLGVLSRLDVRSDIAVTPEFQIGRIYETPFSGGIQSDFTVLSSYLRTYAALRGSYQAGQARTTLAFDWTNLDFSTINVGNGTIRSQRDRNREAWRVTGQVEYALTPSATVFGQLGYERVDYDNLLLSGAPNRSSDAVRFLAGMNLDLAGLLRGSIGVGYTHRKYDTPSLYPTLDGFAAQVRLEYFPSELTTLSLSASRTIEDSNILGTTGYFDNRIRAQIDHEMLRNLILSGSVDYSHQNYVGTNLKNDVVGVRGQARYLANRRLNLNSTISYTSRNRNGAGLGSDFDEFRVLFGATLQY